MQLYDGSYGSVDGSCSESCALVIVALTVLGMNPETDSRFVKNGISVVDALCSFYVDGGGFRHVTDGNLDGMATEQGYYALAAYERFLNEQTSLYDMSDVVIRKNQNFNDQDDTDQKNDDSIDDDKKDNNNNSANNGDDHTGNDNSKDNGKDATSVKGTDTSDESMVMIYFMLFLLGALAVQMYGFQAKKKKN